MPSGAIKFDSPADRAQAVGGTVPYLEQLSGNEIGKRIELRGSRASLGRGEDNDIVLVAEGVSRRHAFMAMSEGDWFIRDNDSKNGVILNGAKVKEAWLANGDVVGLGDFVFRFHFSKVAENPYGNPADLPMASPAAGGLAGADFHSTLAPNAAASVSKAKPKANRRLIIYGSVAALLAALYFMSSGTNSPSPEGVQTASDKLARDFDVSKKPDEKFDSSAKIPPGLEDPLLKKAEQEMSSLDWSDTSLQQAELFFRRGQRDYLNKNYHRAIEAFQTALSLYKGHSLAERYLRHAVSEAEYEAKQNLALGVQYFEALQYQRAIYHFQMTIQLLAHRPNEPAVKEAQRYIEQAQLRLRAAELFP